MISFLPEKNSIRNWGYDVGECNKSDVFYDGPGCMATIELQLRRTLVRLDGYSAKEQQASDERQIKGLRLWWKFGCT